MCKGSSVNQLVSVVTGENAWRSLGREWELTWSLDAQIIRMCTTETRNMKSLFTLGKLVQRTETWIKQFCENMKLIAIDILAFQSDMIYKRAEIFFRVFIYLNFPPFCAFCVWFCLFVVALGKGEHFSFSSVFEFSYAIFFHANSRSIWFQALNPLAGISRASQVRSIPMNLLLWNFK